jgi:large subunit ribosomal protein L23
VNPYSVLQKPLLSEKSNRGRENENKYTFLVATKASKNDVKNAVEKVFNVKVEGVTTLIVRGKVKRRGNNIAKLANTKKAVVTLKQGEKIGLFEDL